MPKKIAVVLLMIALVIVLIAASSMWNKFYTNAETNNQVIPSTTTITAPQDYITTKLDSISGGDFSTAAGYYEGSLTLHNQNGKEYSLFYCTKDWSIIKAGNCFNLSPTELEKNTESHKFSMELSGCYTGSLEPTPCF